MGISTKFTSQLKPRDSIALRGQVVEVVQIISDTELTIKKELTKDEERATYKCVPRIEQEAVYQHVHDELNNRKCITIFPEGGSHDRAEMLPLKGNQSNALLFIFP